MEMDEDYHQGVLVVKNGCGGKPFVPAGRCPCICIEHADDVIDLLSQNL